MDTSAEPPPVRGAVGAIHVVGIVFAAGVLLSFPISVGPFFEQLAAERSVPIPPSAQLFFGGWLPTLLALGPALLLALAHATQASRPRGARWLCRLALWAGLAGAAAALASIADWRP